MWWVSVVDRCYQWWTITADRKGIGDSGFLVVCKDKHNNFISSLMISMSPWTPHSDDIDYVLSYNIRKQHHLVIIVVILVLWYLVSFVLVSIRPITMLQRFLDFYWKHCVWSMFRCLLCYFAQRTQNMHTCPNCWKNEESIYKRNKRPQVNAQKEEKVS